MKFKLNRDVQRARRAAPASGPPWQAAATASRPVASLRRVLAAFFLAIVGLSVLLLSGCETDVDLEPTAGVTMAMSEGGDTATEPLGAEPRMIIRTANMVVVVQDMEESEVELRSLTGEFKGIVESSSLQYRQGVPRSEVVVRVPVESFDAFLEKVEDLGFVRSRTLESTDVTTEAIDIEARLKVLRAEEQSLMRLLDQAKSVTQVIEVRKVLTETRQQIESLEARYKYLSRQASLSTAKIYLEERPGAGIGQAAPGWLQDTFTLAFVSLLAVGRWLLQVAVWLAVFSPIWGGIILFAWWMRRRRRRIPPPVI
ncbi:MAG: DUF4349 domain-containing protein [Fimbriimonadaceae bacterium]